MLAIIGVVVVLGAVVGGFTMEGGPPLVLIQPVELLIIGGAVIGGLLIAVPLKVLKILMSQVIGILGSGLSKQAYLEVLQVMHDLFTKAKREGFTAIDSDLVAPEKSPIFSKYKGFTKNHHAMAFLCDSLRLVVDGAANPDELDTIMETGLETHHEEGSQTSSILNKVGDSLPGLGIVAAVLGIVITMQVIDGPPAEIGHKVATALVGTFIGILLSYGIIQPMAQNLEHQAQCEGKYLACIKACLVAFARGAPPIVAVEFGRRVIFSYDRPSNQEMESACKGTPIKETA
ncbi:flagellar motor stator protein MotA [Candidatus Methylomirabilis sp.]|uniref:flagellar motor stator protein MotA n=1 Tax=Candidatus Methylomirabilis sp. TaxID=2032687 RepID=UPI002A6967EA|nr:flagellar motor stator protein MotA [Candidatus Methylomirabilis sp.]